MIILLSVCVAVLFLLVFGIIKEIVSISCEVHEEIEDMEDGLQEEINNLHQRINKLEDRLG